MRKLTAAYGTFDTFIQALEDFREHGIPSEVLKYLDANYSRHNKWQLYGAFNFFGLLDADGLPTQMFRELVAAKDRRAEILRDLLPKSYPILFQGGIEHLTRERLDTALSENYGAHRDTQKKARSFFFRACEFAGIPLPATLTMRPAGGNVQVGNQLRLQTQESGSPTGGNGNMQETSHGNGGHGVPPAFRNTIILKSGGRLTLSAEVDIWKLGKEDRDLVFRLVDDMKDYETETSESS